MPHVKYYITCQVLHDSSFQTFMYDKSRKTKMHFHVKPLYYRGTAQHNVAFKPSSTVATPVTAFKKNVHDSHAEHTCTTVPEQHTHYKEHNQPPPHPSITHSITHTLSFDECFQHPAALVSITYKMNNNECFDMKTVITHYMM